MPEINSISQRQATLLSATVQQPMAPSAPVNSFGASREDNLQQQLDAQLSSEIARIRRQLSGLNQPDPNSADGNGRVLNIGV